MSPFNQIFAADLNLFFFFFFSFLFFYVFIIGLLFTICFVLCISSHIEDQNPTKNVFQFSEQHK